MGPGSIEVRKALIWAVMLAIVVASYRQTNKAYPHGASSYLVASDNLGPTAGEVAGSIGG